MKKTLAMLLAVVMVASLFAGCSKNDPAPTDAPATGDATGDPEATVEELTGVAGQYTYKDSVSLLASNWNPHTHQSTTDAYPLDYLTVGLYSFVFNDELHPVEGKDPYTGYQIVPEMAASMPVDVTETVKAEHPEFGIPESATAGYAYTIDLNPLATWDDGTPITADTYVQSMELLLRPELLNYRATDYYTGDRAIAGAEAYAKSGRTVKEDNGLNGTYTFADLVKGDDGKYTTPDGMPVYVAVNFATSHLQGDTLKAYVDNYGDSVFNMENWEALLAQADDKGVAPLTDETYNYLVSVIATEAWNETEADAAAYLLYDKTYPEVPFESVGLYKSGEYQITMVLNKALAGFNLLYSLGSNWLVKPDVYEANLKDSGGFWTNTYYTSAETSPSYGPYKLVSFQSGKAMRFEKNDKWYGYTDGKHVYVDPTDGETYDMYQTTAIDCQVVEEAATMKMMFLKGQLSGYGLQADDFATYRNSEYCHATPRETIFFLILNGHEESINKREAAKDFDQTTTDLQTMLLVPFRKALGLTYDRELFAATISPARSGGYGLIGNAFIYDPDTGARYRDSDQAKKALCDFYSIKVEDFASLDDAVDSITGYDPEMAKEYFKEAFDEALEKGYITDTDGNGVSDQTVTIEYALAADNDFMTKTIDYLNEKVSEVTNGTPFEGKVAFVKSAPYGEQSTDKLKAGLSDTTLSGWSGSKLNPFGVTDVYTNPNYQYDAAWFDSTSVNLTLNVPVNGTKTDVTMNLRQWSDSLNGNMVTVDGVDYNFGDGIADVNTRLDILAGIEGAILKTYNYLPMLEDGSMALLSQQMFYVVDEYNPIMGRGGIQYMKYNYDDAEWADYVNSQNGQLKY